MPNDTYVLLTGAINNSGDFLIVKRAKALLTRYRSDRQLIEYDRWKPLSSEALDVINDSRALLLTGGPALRSNIYPGIYPLVADLDDIRVPIIAFGLGWKANTWDSGSIAQYRFTERSRVLLNRLRNSGYPSSVRDDWSLELMLVNDVPNVMMTGCPAMYEPMFFGIPLDAPNIISSIVMSLGVSYRSDKEKENQTRNIINSLQRNYPDASLTVALHHATDLSQYDFPMKTINSQKNAQSRFLAWLDSEGVSYEDVSGNAKRMENLYGSSDIHIGYRVHGHILMCSISRPSILIAEDSRGLSLGVSTNSIVLNSQYSDMSSLSERVVRKLWPGTIRRKSLPNLSNIVIANLKYEESNGYPRISRSRRRIDEAFHVMKRYLMKLP